MCYGVSGEETCVMGCLGRKHVLWGVWGGNMCYGVSGEEACVMGCLGRKHVLWGV